MRVATITLAALMALGLAAPASAGPVGSHAQIHTCCMPAEQAERTFSESKAMGAAYIRVDFELDAIFHGGAPDWSRVDRMLALSREHRLPILGIALAPAGDPAEFGRRAGELAAHAGDVVDHWEILNEPDADWAFKGTPEQYARMLSASHDAIKAQAPEDKIVLGGLMTPWETGWLDRVFATPGADAVHKFDIAGVHLRGPAGGLAHNLTDWRAFLRARGFGGPAWVTEHGYSADSVHQSDPAYVGGEPAQAAYLSRSLPTLWRAGAEQVFVTLRDFGAPEWAAEGLESIAGEGDFAARRRPAFDVVRTLATRDDQVSYAIAAVGF